MTLGGVGHAKLSVKRRPPSLCASLWPSLPQVPALTFLWEVFNRSHLRGKGSEKRNGVKRSDTERRKKSNAQVINRSMDILAAQVVFRSACQVLTWMVGLPCFEFLGGLSDLLSSHWTSTWPRLCFIGGKTMKYFYSGEFWQCLSLAQRSDSQDEAMLWKRSHLSALCVAILLENTQAPDSKHSLLSNWQLICFCICAL